MQYDPFAANNLFRIIALAGLLVMMTEVVPGQACLVIGIVCLLSSSVLSLFPRPRTANAKRKRPSAIQSARQTPAPAPAYQGPQRWQPAPPAIEPHPALFATVTNPPKGLGSSRRRN